MPNSFTRTLFIAALAALFTTTHTSADDKPKTPRPRVDVHLYGGDTSDGAPLADWYRQIGITDVWLYPLRGAFPQDQRPETQRTADDLIAAKTLKNYRDNSIRYWWFERPVPDFFYLVGKHKDSPTSHIWGDGPKTDALWAGICRRIREIYPTARRAGFSGVVYDNESYYSYAGDESGKKKPWVWGGHENQYGKSGNYYRRGLQVGRAIHAAWPEAKVIMVYAFGYKGERWWYQGVNDGGAKVLIGPEHTYGAGQGELGSQYYHRWWNGRKTKATCDDKRRQFPFATSNRQVLAGLFPIDFGTRKPNYHARYFRAQLASAASEDPTPIHVWLWPQGPFTPQSWQSIDYAPGESAEDYLKALREFSSAFAK